MFELERVVASHDGHTYSRLIYESASINTNPIVSINFSIYPTVNTRKLFKVLLENYSETDNCSRISEADINKFEYSFTDEMDIINAMNYTLYNVFGGEEHSVTYPVIVKILSDPIETLIQFDKNFKKFFDENFRI